MPSGHDRPARRRHARLLVARARSRRCRSSGRLEPHDDLGWRLRLVKSPAEQELLRAASAIGSRAVEAVMDVRASPAPPRPRPPRRASRSWSRPAPCCTASPSPPARTRTTTRRASRRPTTPAGRCSAGDMARVDLYGSVDGYLFDFGRTRVVGRAPDDDQAALLDAVRETTLAGLEAVRPGATVGDIGRACDRHWARRSWCGAGWRRRRASPPGATRPRSAGRSRGSRPPRRRARAGHVPVRREAPAGARRGRRELRGDVLVTAGGYELLTTAPRTFG